MAMQGRLLRHGGRLPIRAMLDMGSSKIGSSSIQSQQLRQFQTSFSRFTLASSPPPTTETSSLGCSTGTTWNGEHHYASMLTGRRTFAATTDNNNNNNEEEEEKSKDTTLETETTTTESEEETPKETEAKEPENVLAALPEGFTPGQAVYHLHKKGTAVTLPEIHDLVKSVVPGKRKHASVLRNALKEYKRTRGLVIGREEATLVMEATMKALQPVENATGQDKLKNALIMLDMFLDPSTGLYFSSPTPPVDDVFALMLEGIVEENLPRVEKEEDEDDGEDEDEDDNDGGEVTTQLYSVPERGRKRQFRKMLRKLHLMPHPTPKKAEPRGEETPEQLSERVAETTIRIIEILNMRKSRPYRKMKKRAAKSYLKQIRIHHGPTPNTVHLATQIMLHVRGSAMEEIVTPCKDNRVPVKPETLVLMEEHAAAELEQQQSEPEEESAGDDSSEGDDDSETKKE